MPEEPAATGSDPTGATPPTPPPAPPAPDGNTEPTRTFTQDEVNAIATREADKARRTATAQLVREAGFSTVEELKADIEATKAAKLAAMTEAERLATQAAEREAAAEAREAAATAVILGLTKQKALMAAGVPERYAETLVDLVKVEASASAEDVATAVVALKELMPHLFVAPAGPGGPSSEPSNGAVPPKRTDSLSALDKGAQEAARRGKGRTPPA
jgi:hypothetical protein